MAVTGALGVADLELAVEVVEEEACHTDSVDGVQKSSISDNRLRFVLVEVVAVRHESVGEQVIV